jgi:hypothetical protein
VLAFEMLAARLHEMALAVELLTEPTRFNRASDLAGVRSIGKRFARGTDISVSAGLGPSERRLDVLRFASPARSAGPVIEVSASASL